MSTTTTTNLGLIKSAYNTEKNDWGTHINDSFDLIDAFAGNVGEKKLLAGTNSSATFTLALSNSYSAYRLRLFDCRPTASQPYLRMSVDGGSTYLTTGVYDWVRRDLSNQSSGTQTLAGSATDTSFLLGPTAENQGTNTDDGGFVDLVVSTFAKLTTYTINVHGVTSFRNSGGYMSRSEFSGSIVSPTAKATNLKIGCSGSSFGDALLCRYVLTGIQNVTA